MGTRVVCDTSINVSDRHIIFELWPHVAPGRVTLSLHALRVRTHVPTSLVFGSRRATLRRPQRPRAGWLHGQPAHVPGRSQLAHPVGDPDRASDADKVEKHHKA